VPVPFGDTTGNVGPMGTTVTVERQVAATPATVWALVSDVERMGEFSPETTGCEWVGEQRGPVVGARFRGRNRFGSRQWQTSCRVVGSEPGRLFAFEVTAAGLRVARWEYHVEAAGDGTRLVETWIDQRGRLAALVGGMVTGVGDRETHNRDGMVATLDRVAEVAEAAEAAGPAGPAGPAGAVPPPA